MSLGGCSVGEPEKRPFLQESVDFQAFTPTCKDSPFELQLIARQVFTKEFGSQEQEALVLPQPLSQSI